MDPSKQRFLNELMQYLSEGQGADLKSRYGAQPAPAAPQSDKALLEPLVESPENRAARKRQEYQEETEASDGEEIPSGLNGLDSAAHKQELNRQKAAANTNDSPSVMDQLMKLLGR